MLALAVGAGGVVVTVDAPAVAAPVPAVVVPAQATTTPADPDVTVTGTSVVSQIDDPVSSRRVNRIIAALLGLAALVLVLTIWFWRSTAPLHPALDGVDLMSTRGYLKAKPARREAMLDRLGRRRGDLTDRVVPEASRLKDPTPVEAVPPTILPDEDVSATRG